MADLVTASPEIIKIEVGGLKRLFMELAEPCACQIAEGWHMRAYDVYLHANHAKRSDLFFKRHNTTQHNTTQHDSLYSVRT